MKKVTLRFPSLQLMADCMYQLGLPNSVIDYELYQFTADLTDKQVKDAQDCDGVVVDIIVLE
jgi:hypothetical protein